MNFFSGKVFRRYILSYLSVILIICAVLVVSLMAISLAELKKNERNTYISRTAVAADYIDTQLKAMEDIRLKVKTKSVFLPFYLSQNPYNEVELMEVFSEYGSYSAWTGQYFLWYLDSGRVYGVSQSYSVDVFLRYVLSRIPESEILALAQTAGSRGLALMPLPGQEDTLLCCLPFYFGTSFSGRQDCLLLFLVKTQQVVADIANMTAVGRGAAFSLSVNGREVISSPLQDPITASSASGRVTLALEKSSFPTSHSIDSYQRLLLLIVASVALFGVLLAVWAAYRNYRPIHSLYSKYAKAGQKAGNELQAIEALLINNREDISRSQKEMDEQLHLMEKQRAYLKQQLVMMLISGNDSPVVSRQIQELGYQLEHELYVILFLHLDENQDSPEITQDIEAFSDTEYSLYAAELQVNKEYAVLVNFDEEDQFQDILELISDMLATRGLKARAQISSPCRSLGCIPSTAMAALNSRNLRLCPSDAAEEEDDDRGLEQVLSMAQAGKMQQAVTLLDALTASVHSRYPSYIMRIYVLNSMAQRIHNFAMQQGAISAQEILASNTDPDELSENMRQMVRAISANAPARPPKQERQGGDVAAYIRENCLNSDITLSSTAQALDISTKQVTRMLHCEINKTFKEYLMELRMEAAKRILRDENLSIVETAEKVGYYNVSHFIKCFRDYAGITPGEWKRIVNSTPGDGNE